MRRQGPAGWYLYQCASQEFHTDVREYSQACYDTVYTTSLAALGDAINGDLETKQHSYRLLRLTAWTIPVFMMKVVEMLEVEVRVADCLIVSVKLHVQIGHPELTHLVGTLLVL